MDCISFSRSAIPPGIKVLTKIFRTEISFEAYRTSVLVLTFIAYTLYHVSRKPTSIVKNVLQSDESLHASSGIVLKNDTANETMFLDGKTIQGWAPFNTESGTALLGEVDVAFLASYAIGMYFAGHLGDRLCNRWFLTVGMIGSGICVSLFGMAYWWNIHSLSYFFVVQIIAGLFQATGWPSVVTVVARWFGKRKRGLIMGIWNAHTSVGNILGSLIASAVLKYGWGWCFVVPGITIAAGGVLIFLFLVVDPVIVGLPSPYEKIESKFKAEGTLSRDEENGIEDATVKLAIDPEIGSVQDDKSQPLLRDAQVVDRAETSQESAVGFFRAWRIPGVAPFAFCLFFTKLVAYTFLYWLPYYIKHTEIQGEYLSDATAGNLSTLFDIGGVLGGILAGYISDRMRARAITAAFFMYAAIPSLILYYLYGSVSLWLNMLLLFIAGVFVNGPYALITTAVSADLGTHESLKGNSRALATVTAIIDGTGSVGAAAGPLLTGYLSEVGWSYVFLMLIISALSAGLLLTKLVITEVKALVNKADGSSNENLRQSRQ